MYYKAFFHIVVKLSISQDWIQKIPKKPLLDT